MSAKNKITALFAFNILFVLLFWTIFNSIWGTKSSALWLALVVIFSIVSYFCQLFYLPLNYNSQMRIQYASLGAATIITISRGYLLAMLAGFLFCPMYNTINYPWVKWLPGFIYLIAGIADYLDGYIARVRQHESLFGQKLENYFDSFGLMAAPILAVVLRRLPLWYLLIIVVQSVVSIVLFIRKTFGRKNAEIPARPNARIVAGIQMGFVGFALLPLFSVNALALVALAVLFPSMWEFIVDLLHATRPSIIKLLDKKSQLFSNMKLILRIAIFVFAIFMLPKLSIHQNIFYLFLLLTGIFLITLGFFPRLSAILFAVYLGLNFSDHFLIATMLFCLSLEFMIGPGKTVVSNIEEYFLLKKLGP